MAATGLKEERATFPGGQPIKEKPLRQEIAPRRYDLDWIRILIILTLVPYHTALIYLEDESFYIKNGQLSMAFDGFVSFVGSWGMQVLFIVAGAASCFALRNTTASQFFRKKLLRLLLPLLFGVLVIVPPIAYFARLNKGSYTGTYWQFYPHFFEFDPADANGFNGHFGPAHLWFVLFLFVLSVIALPLFAWFKGDKGQRFCAWLARACEKPGLIFLCPLLVVLTDGFPDLGGDTFNLLKSLVYLILGYIFVSDPRFQQSLDRQKFLALFLAIVSSVIYMLVREWGITQSGFTLGAVTFDLLHDFNTWAIAMMLFAFGHSYFNFPSRAWKYLNEASYPFYMLHMTVIIIIGYYVAQWDMTLIPEFLITVFASYIATFGLYELLVRRLSFVRLLFGLKPERHQA